MQCFHDLSEKQRLSLCLLCSGQAGDTLYTVTLRSFITDVHAWPCTVGCFIAFEVFLEETI